MEALWTNISTGEISAYEQLYISLYKRFFNYGRKFTADIPMLEDVLQEVLLTVWMQRERIPALQNPHAYYFASFRNALFARLKQAQNMMPVASVSEEIDFSADHFIINKEWNQEMQQNLLRALNSLTPRQREAIYLRFYEGFSYAEVAVALGITEKATYKIMARALLQLRSTMNLPILTVLLLLRQLPV
ncbi:sigma-70 family RNA polymerase sigma factor [Pseudoflavitalea sp. G-6-1-2]|uniref:RNA polymerase sigma factor n=1 Tax=Pseudoflavitalea sp. G-6-1-2 TaxID=2728841 RepID=UPI00146D1F43|nr:sigma-70 family RNA polymerase sigma factor [Pseudoflavitalea sp. G-6-1-2]NML22238.1 sigma-70 family RNA polymerase sigma factor [Pseudoflavitalea sp. G-6-1-2]